MKRRKIFAVTFFISTCLLYGCQATPAEDIVVGKNDGILESAIQETEERSQLDGWEDSWKATFNGAENMVKIYVDAEVKVPDVEKVPVYKAKPHEITIEEAKAWGDTLFQGYPAYEQLETMTKNEIEETILQLKQAMGQGGSLEQEYGDNPVILEQMRADYQEDIAFYESKYAPAPENYEREPAEWVFHPYYFYNYKADLSVGSEEYQRLNQSMVMKFDVTVGQYPFFFHAHNREASDYKVHSLFWGTDDRRVYQKTPHDLSESEIEQMASDFLESTGLADRWRLKDYSEEELTINYEIAMLADPGNKELEEKAKNPESEYWYDMTFVPVYGGIEVTPQSGISVLHDTENPYAANYEYESLSLKISNGMIIDARWNAPMEIVSVENENVSLLTWSEITERFTSQAQIQYTSSYFTQGGGNAWVEAAEVYVTEIELGLVRIREKDSEDTYYYVPAWTFKGTTRANYGKGMPEMGDYIENLMVINAVDGSIINTNLGY